MPPDGYETVTLPVSLADDLEAIGKRSHAETIQHLLAEYGTGGADMVDARVVDMDASERRRIAEEVGEVLQR